MNIRRLFLVLLTAVVAVLVAVPAQAYTIVQSNVPTRPIVYQVQGSHQSPNNPVGSPLTPQPKLYQAGPIVYRVGSGTETVKVTYRVYKYVGSAWVKQQTFSGSKNIPANVQSVQMPYLSFLSNSGAGYYFVDFDLTWTSPIGAVIGSFKGSMNKVGDYVCGQTSRTCQATNGYIYLG